MVMEDTNLVVSIAGQATILCGLPRLISGPSVEH
jgi:hypothetical protein